MTTSLVQFGKDSNTVAIVDRKGNEQGQRLLSAKEFKTARGLKGAEGSRQFNAYLREHGKGAQMGQLSAAVAQGKLLLRAWKDTGNTVQAFFLKADKIVDKASKSAPAPAPKIEDVFNMLDEADKAQFIAQFIGKAA